MKLLGTIESAKIGEFELQKYLKLAKWADHVRQSLPIAIPCVSILHQILFTGSYQQIQQLASLAQLPRFAQIKKAHSSDPNAKRGIIEFAAFAHERVEKLNSMIKDVDSIGLPDSWLFAKTPQLHSSISRLMLRLKELEQASEAKAVLEGDYQGLETSIETLQAALEYVREIHTSGVPEVAKNWLLSNQATSNCQQLTKLCVALNVHLERYEKVINELQAITPVDWQLWIRTRTPSGVNLQSMLDHFHRCNSDAESLQLLIDYLRTENLVRESRMEKFLEWLEKTAWRGSGLPLVCRRICYQSLIREIIAEKPILAQFTGERYSTAREQFRLLDKQLIKLRQSNIASQLLRRPVEPGNGTGPRGAWTDLALIQNEVNKQKRHISVRSLLDRASTAIQQLMPCFMMSPLSVAQYLKPGSIEFDLVVMDEASQLRPEDAIGSIVRSRQLVVVGDPKQLPPTQFFLGGELSANDADEEDVANESSILDVALQVMSPAKRLKWHYRSRHASLIAFSNKEFYNSELVIFPTPLSNHAAFGVKYEFIQNAVYCQGVNPIEAKQIAEKCVEYVENHPERSVGVVTLNQKQCDLVKLEIDRLATEHPDFESWRKKYDDSLEPFFVKNLENVQGDERDAIFISTVYGKDEKGNLYQRFGPINGKDGHRRLNVLFTRAKCQVILCSSIDPSELRVDEKTSWGVRALKGFLKFAKDGFYEEAIASGRKPDSEFEVSVATALRQHQFTVVPQIGVAGYFIDLAVVNPKKPGEFVLGIECDGAAYHSGKSVRDRDRLRQEILERLSWRIHRVWSLDWYRQPKKEVDKLVQAVQQAIRASDATT